jgi:DNA-binding transcriptional regulator/RsmH inhibitor MraZ
VETYLLHWQHISEQEMNDNAPQKISFSKKVDEQGRLVIPKEHRKALTIEGRSALVQFEAKKITYLDDDEDGGGQ